MATPAVHARGCGGPRSARTLGRRGLLLGSGAAALTVATNRHGQAQSSSVQPDHTIRIGPVSLALAPGRIVRTTGYNGTVPGPVLRLKEGKPVAINVVNQSGYPNLVHWHGLYLPSAQDGTM